MFDFRYHALSLAGVFIALVVGLLLGVAIGDKELVSSARQDIRDSLRNDVRRADTERDAAKAQLSAEQTYGDKTYPILTEGRLRNRKIGLVTLGRTDISADTVQEWLDPSGASLSLAAELKEDVDVKALAERATGTRYAGMDRNPALIGDLGRRAGVQMVLGGDLVGRLRPALLQSTSGEFGGLDGVIVVRPAAEPEDKQVAERLATLQDGIVRGLASTGVKVVGIQAKDTDPSQIGWYRDRELSTVDNIDEIAGHAALVFVLAGADGEFGRGDGAQDLLPPVVATVPSGP
jgi:hypothetical protein